MNLMFRLGVKTAILIDWQNAEREQLSQKCRKTGAWPNSHHSLQQSHLQDRRNRLEYKPHDVHVSGKLLSRDGLEN